MKTESKNELRNRIKYLEQQTEKLQNKINEERNIEWAKNLPIAIQKFHEVANTIFPNLICKINFEHCDEAGYWFTFELKNDSREQTYCIRHTDIN